MDILFKRHVTGETTPLRYDEFKARIGNGEVFPQDQVKDRVLTNDQWRTVDNLRIFHKLSPTHYDKGPHLVTREKAEDEERRLEEEARIQSAEEEDLARQFFRVEESCRGFIPAALYRFLMGCQEKPLVQQEFAVRFTYLPSFHKPLFVRASRLGVDWELTCQAHGGSEKACLRLVHHQTEQILRLAEAVNLRAMAPDEDLTGLDGSTWALEIAQRGDYAIRWRWSPDLSMNERGLDEFVTLGKYLVGLSGLVSSTSEMY